MEEKFFVHEIRTGEETFKGIVICDDINEALQTYHSFLGAYAYGHHDKTNFVQCMITDMNCPTQYTENWRVAPQAVTPSEV